MPSDAEIEAALTEAMAKPAGPSDAEIEAAIAEAQKTHASNPFTADAFNAFRKGMGELPAPDPIAAVRGLEQAATFGQRDKIAGTAIGLGKLLSKVARGEKASGLREELKSAVQSEEVDSKADAERAPGSYAGGEVGGAFLPTGGLGGLLGRVPEGASALARVARGGLEGGALSALSSYGRGDSDPLSSAVQGAALGGGLSALPGAARSASDYLREVARRQGRGALAGFGRIAAKKELSPEAVDFARKSGVLTALSTQRGMWDKAKDVNQSIYENEWSPLLNKLEGKGFTGASSPDMQKRLLSGASAARAVDPADEGKYSRDLLDAASSIGKTESLAPFRALGENPLTRRAREARGGVLVSMDPEKLSARYAADFPNAPPLVTNPQSLQTALQTSVDTSAPRVSLTQAGKLSIADGQHRISAAMQQGKNILVEVPEKASSSSIQDILGNSAQQYGQLNDQVDLGKVFDLRAPMSLKQQELVRRSFQQAAQNEFSRVGGSTAHGRALKATAGEVRQSTEDAIAAQASKDPDLAASFVPVKERLGLSIAVEKAAEEKAMRMSSHKPKSIAIPLLAGAVTGPAGGHAANAALGAATMTAARGLDAVLPSTLSAGAYRASGALGGVANVDEATQRLVRALRDRGIMQQELSPQVARALADYLGLEKNDAP